MRKLSKAVSMRTWTDFALVVAGTLRLFDDTPTGDRKLSYSFPASLHAVCRYIAAVEGADRAEFVKSLVSTLDWISCDNLKPRYQLLCDGPVEAGTTQLTLAHFAVTEEDAYQGITLLDKFGVFAWFTNFPSDTCEMPTEQFNLRLKALQSLNERWTFEVVNRILRQLRFSGNSSARTRPERI